MIFPERYVYLEMALPEIAAHRADDSPLEAVGLVWETGEISRLFNQARSSTRFAVGGQQIDDLLDSFDGEIVGLYHTHTEKPAVPSEADLTMMERIATIEGWCDVDYMIYGTDGLRVWNYDKVGANWIEVLHVEHSLAS